MAPHRTLALLLMISVILIGCASGQRNSCSYYTNTECVRMENCLTVDSRLNTFRGCPRNQICCESDDVYDDSPLPPLVHCGPNHLCLLPSMCGDMHYSHQFRSIKSHQFRSIKVPAPTRCPDNLICCNMDFMDHIYTRDFY